MLHSGEGGRRVFWKQGLAACARVSSEESPGELGPGNQAMRQNVWEDGEHGRADDGKRMGR